VIVVSEALPRRALGTCVRLCCHLHLIVSITIFNFQFTDPPLSFLGFLRSSDIPADTDRAHSTHNHKFLSKVTRYHPCDLGRMDGGGDPERQQALEQYKNKLLESREWESKLKALRMDIKGLQREFETTEDNIKALQSVGQIIGEVLKQLDDERCMF